MLPACNIWRLRRLRQRRGCWAARSNTQRAAYLALKAIAPAAWELVQLFRKMYQTTKSSAYQVMVRAYQKHHSLNAYAQHPSPSPQATGGALQGVSLNTRASPSFWLAFSLVVVNYRSLINKKPRQRLAKKIFVRGLTVSC